MAKYASKVVAKAASWVGLKESDGSFKKIIDIYNSHRPLPVGYKLKYTDAWCAGTVSAVAIDLGYTDIIPCECSCPRMIALMQKMGIWVENENRIPKPGDIIFYDWDDNGVGDNKGGSEHVGIVEKVSGSNIVVIEGNYSNAVKRRTLSVNGRYIRGYGVPKYDAEVTTAIENTVTIKLAELEEGCEGEQVKTLQRILVGLGYDLGKFGSMKNGVDGDFGEKTVSAIKTYQKLHDLGVDGIVGEKTWTKLLKG